MRFAALLRRFFLIPALLVAGATLAVQAQDSALRASKPAVKAQIIATIEGQLEAFRAGDIEKAYGFAGETLREQVSPSAFVRMVQLSYPEVWSNTKAEFGVVRDDGERAVLLVHVYTADSEASYDYVLKREAATWRIIGVLRHSPQASDRV